MMNHRLPVLPGLLACCLAASSCDLINPAEPVPAYLQVEPFTVQPSATYGSGASKITDVYVIVDNVSLGAYALPATFPVLADGFHQVILSPGIVVNGISNARGIYPFYETDTRGLVLEPGQVLRIDPVTSYKNATLSWLEDFDTPGFSLEATSSSEVPITAFPANDPEIFEGNNSGRVVLTSPDSFFDLVTSSDFTLSINTTIFLEINYKCNNTFHIGLVANYGSTTQRQAVLSVNPKETWNKLYVDINTGVVSSPGALNYKIYFTGSRDASLSEAYFYFDNLKLLHD